MKVQFSITAVDPFDLPRLFRRVPIDRLDAIHIDVTDDRFAPGFNWGWQTSAGSHLPGTPSPPRCTS